MPPLLPESLLREYSALPASLNKVFLIAEGQQCFLYQADRADDSLVVSAGTIKDEDISAMDIALNGAGDIDLADGISVRGIIDKIHGRLGTKDGIREELRMVIRIDGNQESSLAPGNVGVSKPRVREIELGAKIPDIDQFGVVFVTPALKSPCF